MFKWFETDAEELEYRRMQTIQMRRSLWKTRALLVGAVVGAVYLAKTKNDNDNESK